MIYVNLLTSELYDKWDAYVLAHQAASPYHLQAWQKAVQQGYKHNCYYWLATDEQNTIVGVLPTVWVKPPLLKGSLCALPFCDVGGVLADNKEISEELISTAQIFCQQNNIQMFDHRTSNSSAITDNSPAPTGQKVRMLMELPESSDELFSGFKSKLRSQIRKSEKNGLTASTDTNQEHIDCFYQVFARNMRDLGSPVHSKQWFEALIQAYGDNVIIANIWKDEMIVGAGIVLFSGHKACIPWASTNADFNKLAPNMLLYWTLLEYSCDKGCSEFDFGRSTLGEGTFKFKKQWGAKPFTLEWQQLSNGIEIQDNNSQDKGALRSVIEETWKKLPIQLTTFVGPKLRKYVSL